ncbi:MAG TPA: peptidoglycan -binding protein [Stellaceae bacterium]|jgi:chemotaxis protein MotB|nr:peptidoglycan -binding protein [Stellaceae bacterium]
MALGRTRGRRGSIDIWPGFVDALAQLLMVIIFILLVFTVGQFYLSDALSGRDEALKQLQIKISALADELALEKQTSDTLRGNAATLAAQLKAAQDERDALSAKLSTAATDQQTVQAAKAQVEELTAEIAALKDQLAKVAAALDVSNTTVKSQQDQIVELGKKLNLALASKVEELARYRSEFFGKLSEILGNRPDIHIVGDRFVFQAEVLFDPGGADLSDAAKKQLDPVFAALKTIAAKIPPDIHWVLEIDGHTDHRAIHTDQFASNWELSTARAISVVRYAIDQGVPADHLAAAGFADKQPIDTGSTDDAYRKNRRIELKLTER